MAPVCALRSIPRQNARSRGTCLESPRLYKRANLSSYCLSDFVTETFSGKKRILTSELFEQELVKFRNNRCPAEISPMLDGRRSVRCDNVTNICNFFVLERDITQIRGILSMNKIIVVVRNLFFCFLVSK